MYYACITSGDLYHFCCAHTYSAHITIEATSTPVETLTGMASRAALGMGVRGVGNNKNSNSNSNSNSNNSCIVMIITIILLIITTTIIHIYIYIYNVYIYIERESTGPRWTPPRPAPRRPAPRGRRLAVRVCIKTCQSGFREV